MNDELDYHILSNLLFDESEDLMALYALRTEQFIRINPAGCRLLGYASETEALAQAKAHFSWGAAHATEQEIELMRADGQSLKGLVRITAFKGISGEYQLIRLKNLELMQHMQQQLEANDRRYEAVFTNATIGIIVSDRQGKIVSCNALGYRLLGYEEGELLGQSIELLVPESKRGSHVHDRESFYRHPQVRAMGHNRDLYAQRKDGSVFPVEISLSYFQVEEELYAVGYIIDITFKKEAERALLLQNQRIERLNEDLEQKVADRTHALMTTLSQLERSKDELAKALETERELGELKSRFVSMASHEFRTPLTTVLTSASLIEKYPATEQQDKRLRHVQRITASVNHLNDILEEFLSVGKLEEGKVEARITLVALEPLIQEVLSDIQGLRKNGQEFELDLRTPELFPTDASLLRKILVNLLSNAVKYSGEHTVITIQATLEGTGLCLAIQDQGIGISKEDQKHLFERFFRAKNAINYQGTGLGLHIVMKYLELLRGTITLKSELEKGTLVTIHLPGQ